MESILARPKPFSQNNFFLLRDRLVYFDSLLALHSLMYSSGPDPIGFQVLRFVIFFIKILIHGPYACCAITSKKLKTKKQCFVIKKYKTTDLVYSFRNAKHINQVFYHVS